MKRSELKSLIKECVVEVLQHGIGPSLGTELHESAQQHHPQKRNATSRKASKRSETKKNHVPGISTDISPDPIMQSIFSDTAATTLQAQVAGERRGSQMLAEGSDRAAMIVAEHEPDELFEGASNWESLAFGV